jgi:glutamyl-tRNA reductase
LDSFSLEIDSNKERRLSAIAKVEEIISDELLAYREWVEKASLRLLLAESKVKVNKKIKSYFEADIEELCIQSNTNQIMGQLVKQIESSMSTDKIDALITKEVSLALNSM